MVFCSTRSFAHALGRLTGWDKNPASVFWVAIPLAVAGFGLTLWEAILMRQLHGSNVFLFEWAAAVGLLAFSMWPILRLRRSVKALSNRR